ncbi:hypothetical protein GQ457_16G031560 [Hibiscus cannabinus]
MGIYQLPLGLMNERMGILLGGRIGRLIAVDTRRVAGNLGEYFRLYIEIDISKPLRRYIMIGKRLDGSNKFCLLKYERLANFCFGCGLIGHTVSVCPSIPADFTGKYQYGPWLRAPSERHQAKQPLPRQGIIYIDSEVDPIQQPTTSRSKAIPRLPASTPLCPTEPTIADLLQAIGDGKAASRSIKRVHPGKATPSTSTAVKRLKITESTNNITSPSNTTAITVMAEAGD